MNVLSQCAATVQLLLAGLFIEAGSASFQPTTTCVQLSARNRFVPFDSNLGLRSRQRRPPAASALLAGKHGSALSSPPPPNPSEISELAAFASELADAARSAILPYWRQSIDVEVKSEDGRSPAQTVSPVTVADRSAEAAMRRLIESRHPDHGIYGEEYGSIRTDARWVWVLDPIDGTKNFVTGKPVFGTLVSCLHHGVPVVGVIDQCVLDERWVGALGRPTVLNGEPVRVDGSARSLSDATVFTTTPDMFRAGEELTKFESVRGRSERMLYGCDCYAYALVASGFGADAVVEADLGLYDYCALVPVVEGAGGIMTDWNGERLTLSNHVASKGRVVACSNEDLHAEMVALLDGSWESDDSLSKALEGGIGPSLPTLLLGVVLGEALARIGQLSP